MDVFNVCIDRMTIMGNIIGNRLKDFERVINSAFMADLSKVGQSTQGQLFKKVFFSYDAQRARAFNRREFRMEFNPNHITKKEKEWIVENIIPLLTDGGLSRLDIAFDCDSDLSKFEFIQKVQTKKTKIHSKSGDLQTLYLGTRTSKKMVRIYNKSAELRERKRTILNKFINGIRPGDPHTLEDLQVELQEIEKIERPKWWRLEFELKRDSINIDESLFDNLIIKRPAINTVPSVQDRAMIEYLQRHPDEWSQLSKNTRSKFKKMLIDVGEVDEELTEHFRKALSKRKDDLIKQVASWNIK